MSSNGTFYSSTELDAILKQVFTLIRERRPGDADALAEEFGLREWLCESDLG